MGRNTVTGIERGARRRARAAGFSLIELLVVVSIIIVLASVGMAQYRSGVTRAQEAVLREDLFRLRDVIDQYYADKQQYPQTLEDLVTGGTCGRFRRTRSPGLRTRGNWSRRARPGKPDGGTRHLQRPERVGQDGPRRQQVL